MDAIKSINTQDVIYLDKVHSLWTHTTVYFRELQEQEKPRMTFVALVSTHIRHAVNFWHEAHGRMNKKGPRTQYGAEGLRDWLAEGAHMYWDYLPHVASEMAKEAEVEPAMACEAWIMLMFRAFCWSRCHFMCPSEARFPESTRLPSHYWNSKMPVYLG